MQFLPQEILCEIFYFLPVVELVTCRMVCSEFKSLVDSQHVMRASVYFQQYREQHGDHELDPADYYSWCGAVCAMRRISNKYSVIWCLQALARGDWYFSGDADDHVIASVLLESTDVLSSDEIGEFILCMFRVYTVPATRHNRDALSTYLLMCSESMCVRFLQLRIGNSGTTNSKIIKSQIGNSGFVDVGRVLRDRIRNSAELLQIMWQSDWLQCIPLVTLVSCIPDCPEHILNAMLRISTDKPSACINILMYQNVSEDFVNTMLQNVQIQDQMSFTHAMRLYKRRRAKNAKIENTIS